jgi:hypothetical protein
MSRAWRKFHEATTRLLVRNDCNLAASFRPASARASHLSLSKPRGQLNQRMSFPLHIKALQMAMRELVDFSALGVEENNGTVITTRSFIAQRRSTVTRFMRAFTRGIHRYKSDKEFAKKVFARFAQLEDPQLLEATWQEYAPHLQRVPRPTLKGIQLVIESGLAGKVESKPERLVDFSIVDELEQSGFIESVYKG